MRIVLIVIICLVLAVPATVRLIGGAGVVRYDYQSDIIRPQGLNPSDRFVHLEGTRNTRDIGGYPTSNGSVVAAGKAYRSDHLHRLTDDDIAHLSSLGIATVVDLRVESRARRYPDRLWRPASSYRYPVYDRTRPLHLPLLFRRAAVPPLFQESYIEYLEDWGHRFKPVMELLADPGAYPLLYHCTNGKDRSGVLTALIHSLLGVGRQHIISDFSLSNTNLEETVENFIGNEEGLALLVLGVPRSDLFDLMGVRSEWIVHMLDYIENQYGTTERYLVERVGLSSSTIDAIRENLLASSSS